MTPFEPHAKPIDDHIRGHYESAEPRTELLDELARAALAAPAKRPARDWNWRAGAAAAAVAVFSVAFVWKIGAIGPERRGIEIVVPKPESPLSARITDGSKNEDREYFKAVVPAKSPAVPPSVPTSKPMEEAEIAAGAMRAQTPAKDSANVATEALDPSRFDAYGAKTRELDEGARMGLATSGESSPMGGGGRASMSKLAGAAGEGQLGMLGGDAVWDNLDDDRANREKKSAYGPTLVRPDRNEFAPRFDAGFERVAERPLSTFAVDVDTASYSIVKRYLAEGRRPPVDAVRIEELVNAFRYDIPAPRRGQDFTVLAEAASAPWNANHRLARVALATRPISPSDWPAMNLVLLIDVSGSMKAANKLPLAVESFTRLANQLRRQDRIAIVTYAGESGVALPTTPGNDRDAILRALQSLRASGTTHGSAGLDTAYALAWRSHIPGGVNRVLLATDGDFNVGVTDTGSLVNLVRENAAKGVDLTVLGFGTDNLKDARLEAIADRADGNYAFIGSRDDAERVLVRAAGATLITAAHDVKVQVEFNPASVEAYRLIGYENRALAAHDFADDRKDAGDVGFGHVVTALYEIVPRGVGFGAPPELRYQPSAPTGDRAIESASPESFYVKVRYRPTDGGDVREFAVPFNDDGRSLMESTDDMRFAAAVAAFGMGLRDPSSLGAWSFEDSRILAQGAIGSVDPSTRREFANLIGGWWR